MVKITVNVCHDVLYWWLMHTKKSKLFVISLFAIVLFPIVRAFVSSDEPELPPEPQMSIAPTARPTSVIPSQAIPTDYPRMRVDEALELIRKAQTPIPTKPVDMNSGWCFMLENRKEWMTTDECMKFHQMIDGDFRKKLEEAKDHPAEQERIYNEWMAYREMMNNLALTPGAGSN